MNSLDKMFNNSKSPREYATQYLDYLSSLLKSLDTSAIAQMIEALILANQNGKNIFFIGNGGSAATASHFANDLGVGTRFPASPFRAISLTDNNAVLTAIGNDEGYENIFVSQLQNLMRDGDLLVAISASGNSPNIIKAVDYVRRKGNTVIGLTGFDGGRLAQLSNINLNVKTPVGEYGPVEDIHMVFDHLIGTYLYRFVRSESIKNLIPEASTECPSFL